MGGCEGAERSGPVCGAKKFGRALAARGNPQLDSKSKLKHAADPTRFEDQLCNIQLLTKKLGSGVRVRPPCRRLGSMRPVTVACNHRPTWPARDRSRACL